VVCLSVTFVQCAQTAEDIDMISFASHIGSLLNEKTDTENLILNISKNFLSDCYSFS